MENDDERFRCSSSLLAYDDFPWAPSNEKSYDSSQWYECNVCNCCLQWYIKLLDIKTPSNSLTCCHLLLRRLYSILWCVCSIRILSFFFHFQQQIAVRLHLQCALPPCSSVAVGSVLTRVKCVTSPHTVLMGRMKPTAVRTLLKIHNYCTEVSVIWILFADIIYSMVQVWNHVWNSHCPRCCRLEIKVGISSFLVCCIVHRHFSTANSFVNWVEMTLTPTLLVAMTMTSLPSAQRLTVTLRGTPVAGMSLPQMMVLIGSGVRLWQYHQNTRARPPLWTSPPTAQRVKSDHQHQPTSQTVTLCVCLEIVLFSLTEITE